ncbi:MAG: DUF1844 domain-containing protein [Planctomycetes bacterium]|nr:DUF1844 domain-containing protein [Planctomycetota bacterium]
MDNEPNESAEPRKAGEMPLPGGDFRMFISKLGFQALISLGMLENPVTKKTEKNLDFARMVIDDLRMIRDYTKGNLNADEASHLGKIISDLQFHFVNATRSDGGA